MADRPWKAEEREVAALIGGRRYPANSGGRVDVEGPAVVAQVKHVRRLALAVLEALALEMERLGTERGKVGLVVVKRRAGRGKPTPRLLVMTEAAFEACRANLAEADMADSILSKCCVLKAETPSSSRHADEWCSICG